MARLFTPKTPPVVNSSMMNSWTFFQDTQSKQLIHTVLKDEHPFSSLYNKLIHCPTILSEIPDGKELTLSIINELIKSIEHIRQ